MKKIGIIASAFLLAVGVCQAQNAMPTTSGQMNIAVVNVQQVLQQSPRVMAIGKKLENEFKNRQAKMAEEQKSLQDMMDKFKKESPTMSQKDKDAMQKKIVSTRSELVSKVVAYQQEVQKAQNNAMQGVLKEFNGIVTNIAQKNHYSMVFDSQAVIYNSANNNDITKEVASQFNG